MGQHLVYWYGILHNIFGNNNFPPTISYSKVTSYYFYLDRKKCLNQNMFISHLHLPILAKKNPPPFNVDHVWLKSIAVQKRNYIDVELFTQTIPKLWGGVVNSNTECPYTQYSLLIGRKSGSSTKNP